MSKYNNKKTIVNGIKFDSKLESEFYEYLLEMGCDFELQPVFLLQDKFEHNGKKYRKIEYKADFRIGNVVIDVKGQETDVFKLKRKMLLYKYPEIEFYCVKKKNGKWIYY